MKVIAKAPASMMIMGEHAVLQGYPALVMALNQWITVELIPRSDLKIKIHSSLGEYETAIGFVTIEAPLQFVLASIQYYEKELLQGFELTIRSEFLATIGLGSSSAVTVATLAVLQAFLGHEFDQSLLFDQGKKIILAVQGQGSGADIAASVYGGLLQYTLYQKPLLLKAHLALRLIYVGYKTPTVQVIQKVQALSAIYPLFYKNCFQAIGRTVQRAVSALEAGELAAFEAYINENQQLMVDLGVSDECLEEVIHYLRQQAGVRAVKISGSGLGDCVFALTQASILFPPDWTQKGVREIPIQMTDKGVQVFQ